MISPSCPPKPYYCGADLDGFANPTVFKRWPVILDQVVNDLRQELGEKSSDVCNQILQVQKDIVEQRPMTQLVEDHEPDCQQWNDTLQKYFPNASYSKASWLFAECYLYRRIWNIVKSSPVLTNYDPFHSRKKSSLCGSFSKISTACERLLPLLNSRSPVTTRDLLLVSLWGNASDLSMFAGLDQSQIETMNASSGEENIIHNDIDEVCRYLEDLHQGRIDVVLDNSGFELFGDLLLIDHLHRTGVAARTVFHCKSIPWFISDTTPSDFEELLDTLESSSSFVADGLLKVEEAQMLAKTWRGYLARGEWVLKSNYFWTSWWAYHHLPEANLELFSDLRSSSLVIFKGDLNYRKLVYDCRWPSTTPFRQAIGDAIASSLPLLAMRTGKSDPCLGLADGKEQELLAAGHSDWRWSGKFALVQFSLPC